MTLGRLRPDNFTLAIAGAVLVASILPAVGTAEVVLTQVVNLAIAILFFMHGAKLSRAAVIAGLTHWRLHLLIVASTFLLFPLLGIGIRALGLPLPPELIAGIVYLTLLSSTVQSSIAFTSIGRGNVAAAVCAASASNFLGIFLTPVLVSVVMRTSGVAISMDSLESIVLQLLLPFILGQAVQPWIGGFMKRHSKVLGYFDRGSILGVVYLAFGHAVIGGIWHHLTLTMLAALLAVLFGLLAIVLATTTWASRVCGFSREDEVTIVMCGSKKSLASGVPMANILFAGLDLGLLVLPLMIFHQIQLMVCAVIAQRYAARAEAEAAAEAAAAVEPAA
ncbi:bile acid:sodium symporter [Siculibacillus lacustris]|uniref:Bile acid:sodium symporter n=1 Tax=Siculibacillus lacustris TaxID=1549641 RepID=A0A4Q9VRA1_9HYPH|nr:bile acid:sodium symporter family protein [Siculibacillus lacustris]TBW38418.1 bile acid:sodium symporter [Siculibacillus lacustris]